MRSFPVFSISVLGFLVISVCALAKKPDSEAKNQTPVFLNAPEVHQQQLENFLNQHTHPSEKSKIQFLLETIGHSPNKYLRNGQIYSASVTAQWFKWKKTHSQFKKKPIIAARDFVERVTSFSLKTGLPYAVTFPDGRSMPLLKVLQNELEALESAIAESAAKLEAEKIKATLEAAGAQVELK